MKAPTEEQARVLVDVLQNTIDYGIFLLDADGHILTWNAGARRINGYSAEEIVGKHFSLLMPPEDIASHKAEYELKVAASEGHYEDQGWRLRKGGTPYWASIVIAPHRDASGRVAGYVKITRDVTERKQAEEAVRRSEERYRTLVDSVRDYAIFLLDANGRVRTWNRGAQEIKGYRTQEIVGEHISRFYSQEDRARGYPQQLLARAASEGRIEDEGWRVRKDGTRFWADVIITAIHAADGRLVGFSKVTRDLTERREAEAERVRLQQEARETSESNRRLEAFSYTVAHDLRAPIRAIAAFAEDIAQDAESQLSPASRELVGRIGRTAETMGILVEDLLNFSRSERGDIHPKRVDLGKIAQHIVSNSLQRREPHRAGELVVEEGLEVWGDPGLLRIVMDNLLGNAWKFTSKKDRYRIEVRKIEGDGATTVVVRDNGIGFPPERANELFEPFRRLHPPADYPGSGVGLSTVARIVDRHGGRVWAESDPGQGATFYFTLPHAGTSRRPLPNVHEAERVEK